MVVVLVRSWFEIENLGCPRAEIDSPGPSLLLIAFCTILMRKQMCLFPGTTLTSPVELNKCSFVPQLKTPLGETFYKA